MIPLCSESLCLSLVVLPFLEDTVVDACCFSEVSLEGTW